jgi:ribosome-binding protein aMBF1 (putative translation factor)
MPDNLRTFNLPGSDGLVCKHCGTQLSGPSRTVETAGLIIRERVCPSCSKINETTERVIAARDRRRYRRRSYGDAIE